MEMRYDEGLVQERWRGYMMIKNYNKIRNSEIPGASISTKNHARIHRWLPASGNKKC
jgi:hypothetical protein